jgi:hypothetical protein
MYDSAVSVLPLQSDQAIASRVDRLARSPSTRRWLRVELFGLC